MAAPAPNPTMHTAAEHATQGETSDEQVLAAIAVMAVVGMVGMALILGVGYLVVSKLKRLCRPKKRKHQYRSARESQNISALRTIALFVHACISCCDKHSS